MADTRFMFMQKKKFVPKTVWKCKNKAEVHSHFMSEFHKDAPTRITISRILDNFENYGTTQCMRKGHSE